MRHRDSSHIYFLLLFIAAIGNRHVASTTDAEKAGSGSKVRLRAPHLPWRLVVCLTQPQQNSLKTDIHKAWEDARHESSQGMMEVSYVETTTPTSTDSLSYPLMLLDKFCNAIEGERTILSLVIGGGPAARFLIAAATSLNIPTLWLPASHRDFLRQGRKEKFESRLGTGAEEMGAAAAALMHKTNWHAFTLLIDITLLPINQLLLSDMPILTPRSVIHLPADDHSLRTRLRRVAEGGTNGGVLVMACDLKTAQRVIAAASKYGMLAGRFLWLWLDLKMELKPNEPSMTVSNFAPHNSNARTTVNLNVDDYKHPDDNQNYRLEDEIHLHTLPNLANDVHRLQAYRWQEEERPRVRRNERSATRVREQQEGVGEDGVKIPMPVGMLVLRSTNMKISSGDTTVARMLREASEALDETIFESRPRLARLRDAQLKEYFNPSCFARPDAKFLSNEARQNVSHLLTSRLRKSMRQISRDKSEFHLLNLQPAIAPGSSTSSEKSLLKWTKVGTIRGGGRDVRLDTIIWPGGGVIPAYLDQVGDGDGVPAYRIVTALSPPFAMATSLQEGLCLRGIACRHGNRTVCCYGLSIDLLSLVARELGFRFELYVAQDGLFGKRIGIGGKWNGIVGELTSGKAQLAFAPLSVSARRAEVVDFTTPYFFSGVSFLAAPQRKSEIPLLAFLLPFSTELWIAVFTSLNITAMAVAVYEWFSPFGLNPWGRQRSKNFSIASALWVMWGLLCGHLVAFKAPKSWPNKFLINVWGGFSVIFVASYTANIAALIAGLFFHSAVSDYHDRSLLSQRVGAPRASAAEYYVARANPGLSAHMARYSLSDVEEGVEKLRNGTLDILIADTPILDYYRATDNGCRLQKIGDTMNEDTYAVALSKGHPLKESISRAIANYTSNGLLDILQEKWYGGLPCIRGREGRDNGLDPEAGGQPRPLGVASVAGVFCLLGLGVVLGAVILAGEHLFYRYTLPRLRNRPASSIWHSRNVMFFSQKLYRFINCVELVSPHHAARELVHTLRQGQITSLFQKSVKRKEHEQRRRRKSKAQFFEMIQEIRSKTNSDNKFPIFHRVQQEEKTETVSKDVESLRRVTAKKDDKTANKARERSRSKSPLMPRSPKRTEKCRSSTNLSGSRLGLSPISLEAPMRPMEFTLSNTNLRARSPLETVGRRLSHGDGGSPPPRLGSHLGGSANLRPQAPVRGDSLGGGATTPRYSRSPAKRGQSFPVFATLRPPPSGGVAKSKSPLLSPNSELTCAIGRKLSREWGTSNIDLRISSVPEMGSGMEPETETETAPQQQQETTLIIEPFSVPEVKMKPQTGIQGAKKPVRRARSHENRESAKQSIDLPSPRLNVQPVVGGRSVSERTKKQMESELKAIFSARAHHRDLHPP